MVVSISCGCKKMKSVKQRLRELQFVKNYEPEIEILNAAAVQLKTVLTPVESYSDKLSKANFFKGSGNIKNTFFDHEGEFWSALDSRIKLIHSAEIYVCAWDVLENISPIKLPKAQLLDFLRLMFTRGEDDFSIGGPGFPTMYVGRDSLTEDGGRYSYSIGFAGDMLPEADDELR